MIIAGYMELKNVFNEDKNCFTGRFYIVREEPLFEEGFRLLENKNKSFSEDEILTETNPFGNRKVLKKNNKDNYK